MAPEKRKKIPAARRLLAGFPAARPEAVGLCPKPFKRLRAAVKHNVTKLGARSGCAHVVLKDGRCIFAMAEGWSNREKRVKFSLDTMCPLHGATKPLVAAAFLTLVDEKAVKLSDPVDKYLNFPEYFTGGSSGSRKQVSTKATLRHLLAMTAGVGYDDCTNYEEVMSKITRREIIDLTAMCDGLMDAPLQFDPGKRYHYSFSADIIGRVCERVSGQRIDAFIRKRLLRPLGMRNTYFEQVVPAKKRSRMAVLYTSRLAKAGRSPRFCLKPWVAKTSAPGIMSCGGGVLSYRDYGMVSSVRDYARFCQMILSGGLVPGSQRRILKASTVKALWQDGLSAFQQPNGRMPGWNGPPGDYFDTTGWSLLNTHLVFDTGPRRHPPRRGLTMWMGGGGGATWNIDPKRGLVVLSWTPGFEGRDSEEDGFGPLADDATPYAEEAADSVKRARRR
eukprot:TRINITY_DN21957_c0_g1_i2.p1 TRINITY_DN21957_c0_g1~~TRINITY_DN21957_c0_g1_i2.p1  ORF type:complete len:454 (-),score=66.53 TRINITY_DN21957_c0_g1_i2:128-1468(-)